MTLNRRFAIALGITALFGAAVVNAAQLGKADVPFGFEVGGQKMAAGSYTATSHAGGDVVIRNTATGRSAYILPRPADSIRSDDSKLTFTCYGSQCFLSETQFGQTRTSYNVPRSHHEKELAKSERPEEKLIAMR
jgi:hypothetical protein